ncbi:MAG: hypothetical protein GY898_20675 [Proteobacteria bacterium]|nr:hypothetical protein [Pseudomonadota bacterium]
MADTSEPAVRAALAAMAVDGGLMAESLALQLDPVARALAENEAILIWGLGAFQLLFLPLILLIPVARSTPTGDAVLGLAPETFASKAWPWLWTACFGAGFMVPLLGLQVAPLAWTIAVIVGPLLMLGVIGFAMVKLDDKKPSRRLSQGESLALTLGTFCYLALLEGMLFLDRPDEQLDVLVVPALLLAYLPIRLMLFMLRETKPWELATLAMAFVLLMAQLAPA